MFAFRHIALILGLLCLGTGLRSSEALSRHHQGGNAVDDTMDQIPSLADPWLSGSRHPVHVPLSPLAAVDLDSYAVSERTPHDGIINPGEAVTVAASLLATGGDLSNIVVDFAEPDRWMPSYGLPQQRDSWASGSTFTLDPFDATVPLASFTPIVQTLVLRVTADQGTWHLTIPVLTYTSSRLAGTVETANGEPLPDSGSLILDDEEYPLSNTFSLWVRDGTHTLTALAPGYITVRRAFTTPPGNGDIHVLLHRDPFHVGPQPTIVNREPGVLAEWQATFHNNSDDPLRWQLLSHNALEATELWHHSQRRDYDTDGAWYFGDESSGDYDLGRRVQGGLTLPAIPIQADSSLRFASWRETENGTDRDTCTVQIEDSPGTWSVLYQETDVSGSWLQREVSLAAHAGTSKRLRFCFDSVDAVSNDYEGWYIDAMQLDGRTLPAPWTGAPEQDELAAEQQALVDMQFRTDGLVIGYHQVQLPIIVEQGSRTWIHDYPVHLQIGGTPSIVVPHTVWTEVSGDGDGLIEVGETAHVTVVLFNIGRIEALGVHASISHSELTITPSEVDVGSLHSRGSAFLDFSIPVPQQPSTYTYSIRLDTQDQIGQSWTSFLQLDIVPPPLEVEALAVSHESIVISWNALSAAHSYRLWRRIPGTDWQQLSVLPAAVTRHVDNELDPQTRYEYKVEALDTAP